jgi:hypothetical protein
MAKDWAVWVPFKVETPGNSQNKTKQRKDVRHRKVKK